MGNLRASSVAVGLLAWMGANAAFAQAQSDGDFQLLFKQVNSPPNIAILLDDSGHGNVVECVKNIFPTPPVGSTPSDACFYAPTGLTCSTTASTGSGGSLVPGKIKLTLPTNYSKAGTTTRWAKNYVYYILEK